MDLIHYPWVYTDTLEGDFCGLSEDESRHLRCVLRCKEKDFVVAFNGNGCIRLGYLILKKRCCDIIFTEAVRQILPKGSSFQLVQFLPNNVATFEDILRKTCELGIASIYPIYGDRSEPSHWKKEIWNKRFERFHRILIESCKQAKNPFLPIIHDPAYLDDISRDCLGYCYHGSLSAKKIISLNGTYRKVVSCIIGPEGGFSLKEEQLLAEFSQGICLPTCVLRVETAVVGLISVVKTLV